MARKVYVLSSQSDDEDSTVKMESVHETRAQALRHAAAEMNISKWKQTSNNSVRPSWEYYNPEDGMTFFIDRLPLIGGTE